MDKHTDRDVLDTCAKTLELLCHENNAIHSRCNVARGTVIDMIVNKYKEAMDDYSSLVAGVRWRGRGWPEGGEGMGERRARGEGWHWLQCSLVAGLREKRERKRE